MRSTTPRCRTREIRAPLALCVFTIIAAFAPLSLRAALLQGSGEAIQTQARPGEIVRPKPAYPNNNDPRKNEPSDTKLDEPGPSDRSSAKWIRRELWLLVLGVILGGACAAMRLSLQFRQFSGLGLIRTWHSWMFVGFVALFSILSYFGCKEFEALLVAVLKLHPGFMDVLEIAGTGAGGHAPLAAGRLGQLVRGKSAAPPAQEVLGWLGLGGANTFLAFFYVGVGKELEDKVHRQAVEWAPRLDWKTIRNTAHLVLQEQIAFGRIKAEDANTEEQKIDVLSAAADPSVDLTNKQIALVTLIMKCSYGTVQKRLWPS